MKRKTDILPRFDENRLRIQMEEGILFFKELCRHAKT